MKSYRFNTYNKTKVDTKLSTLIGSSPQVSETNVERASALGNAVNYATTIQHQRTTKQTSGTCCLTSEIDIWLTGIGTGLTNRVLNSVVDVEGKLKISSSVDNTVSNIQQLICINPNDSLQITADPSLNTHQY